MRLHKTLSLSVAITDAKRIGAQLSVDFWYHDLYKLHVFKILLRVTEGDQFSNVTQHGMDKAEDHLLPEPSSVQATLECLLHLLSPSHLKVHWNLHRLRAIQIMQFLPWSWHSCTPFNFSLLEYTYISNLCPASKSFTTPLNRAQRTP